MKNRPWIPIAVVLLILLGSTVAIGSVVRSRLVEAELVIRPFMEPGVVETLGSGADAPAPPCQSGVEIAEQVQAFYSAVDRDAGELSTTNPTFDSFLLESALARVSADKHQLLLKARSNDGVWCIDEAVFSTEE